MRYIENLEAFNRMKEQLQAQYGIPKVVYSELGTAINIPLEKRERSKSS